MSDNKKELVIHDKLKGLNNEMGKDIAIIGESPLNKWNYMHSTQKYLMEGESRNSEQTVTKKHYSISFA